jgi:hypothetical protein
MEKTSNKALSFVRTYTLSAQTPLIHFQYEQPGATLRATEVKPKLDRYIVKMLGVKDKIDKKWFINDTDSLNYKIRIIANGIPQKSTNREYACRSVDESAREGRIRIKNGNSINSMYFANMVSAENKTAEQVKQDICDNYKETVFYKDPIKMTVTCFIPELLSVISENIQAFFLLHNFGSRQSKGFGGFVVSEIDGQKCDNSHEAVCKVFGGYKYFYADCGISDVKELMNHALTVYAVLKGGLNMTRWDDRRGDYNAPNNYIKSYLQRPFLDELYGADMGSEKAKIKSRMSISDRATLTENRKENDLNDNKYGQYVFIRALLGLADHYEFRNLRSGTVNIYSLGKDGFDVERFKSPVTIKVVGKYIYYVFDVESISLITGKTFYFLERVPRWFKDAQYAEKKQYIMNNGWEIKTPDSFCEEEVDRLIKGFVAYFERVRSKLNGFTEPFKRSETLVLKEGK